MDFDPYHQWLGIPPYEQPPHHYRLLGVALFEDHADVIESGADRQRSHLRTYLSGPNRMLAERLLEEVAAAKIVLLNPVRRAAYDVELRRRLMATAPVQAVATPVMALPPNLAAVTPVAMPAPAAFQPVSAPVPLSAPVPIAAPDAAAPAAAASPVVNARMARQRRQGQNALFIACLVAGVLLVVAAAMWKSGSFDRAAPSETPAPEPARTIVEKPREETIAPARPSTEPLATPPTQAEEKPATPPTVVGNVPPEKPPTPDPVGVAPPEPPPPAEPPAATAEQSTLKRRPVPTPVEQGKVKQLAEDTYQLRKERSAAEKLQVVQEMLAVADRSSEAPAERFVLLRLAAELAVESGDAALMSQTIDTMAVDFELDPFRVKEVLLKRFAETAVDPARIAALVEAARAFCAEAIKEDRFDEALNIAALVNQVCQRPAAKTFKKEVAERLQRVTQIRDRYQAIAAAESKLAQSPADAQASLAVGQWYCFSRGQWNKGLPYLAKGADTELAALATSELASPPQQADEQVKLGDAWYDLAQTRGGEARDQYLSRAGTWYERAKTAVTSGLVRMKLEKRLAEIAKARPPAADLLVAGGDSHGADTLAPGGWVDLLPRIDTARDTVQGAWKQQGETLVVTASDFARLKLPLHLAQADYDIEIEFNRTEGTEGFGLVLPVGRSQVAFLLSVANGSAGGLDAFERRRVGDGKNPTRRPGSVQSNRRNTVLVGVRNKNNSVAVDAVLNGKAYTRGMGDVSKFSLPTEWAVAETDRPALAAHKSNITFRRVRVRLVSGTATFVTGKGASPRPTGGAPASFTPKLPDPTPPVPSTSPAGAKPEPAKTVAEPGFVPHFPTPGPPAPPPKPRDF